MKTEELFWVDQSRNKKKTYADLINDLNSITGLPRYIYSSNPYVVFLNLLGSMIAGIDVTLIDSDLSKEEIAKLDLEMNNINEPVNIEVFWNIQDFDELINKINEMSKKWTLSLFTSGTTGRPKKVTHKLETITRDVRRSERYQSDIWAFAYNPTHFAGLQVFFQAFFNKNVIVYLFDLAKSEMVSAMGLYQITHISATPTFYRTFIPYIDFPITSIRRVTVGGERFDHNLSKQIVVAFPNAKIKNIYASTEAGSLLNGDNEIFNVPNQIRTSIKISEENELLIHKTLLGQSMRENMEDDWYHSGDIVEIIEASKFKIVSRKTEMINVGGYKVNPHEIEDEIQKIPGIIDVLVYSRTNRITGNILAADIVIAKAINEVDINMLINSSLRGKLQAWKIPRIIRSVEEIPKTRSGKKVRSL